MLRACAYSGRIGRLILVTAVSAFAHSATADSAAAQAYPATTTPYYQPVAPSYMQLPAVTPTNHWDQDAPSPDAHSAEVAQPMSASGAAEPAPIAEEGCGCGASACGGGCHSCGPCFAQRRGCDRWYLSISGGWNTRETVHEVGDPSTFIIFDDGFAANAALGYRFDMFRVEAEYSFMNNETPEAGSGGLASTATGNINLRALMFNLYHDIEIDGWLWKPYLGAGIGIYQSELNAFYPAFFGGIPGFDDSPINATSNMPFAYQFRVGASRPIGERTEFYTGYRYFHGEELTFASAPFASAAAPTFTPDGAWTHGVEFGLRIRF